MCNSVLSKICLLLAIIGGLNWGFVGIWKLDIVAWAARQAGRPAPCIFW